eukprot:2814181-Amphidinium_carterae.1
MAVTDEVRQTLRLAGFRPLPSDYHQQAGPNEGRPETKQPGTISPTLPFPSQNRQPPQEAVQGAADERWQVCMDRPAVVIRDEEGDQFATQHPEEVEQQQHHQADCDLAALTEKAQQAFTMAQTALQLVNEYVAKHATTAHQAQSIVGQGKRQSSETSISAAVTKVQAAVGETLSKRLVNRLVEDTRTSEHILKANSVTQTRDAVAAALRRFGMDELATQ